MVPSSAVTSGQFPVVHEADEAEADEARGGDAGGGASDDALAHSANVRLVPLSIPLPAPLRVVRLSPSTLTCVAEAPVPLSLGESLDFRLTVRGDSLGPLHGVVARLRTLPPRGQRELEIVLARPSLELGRRLLGLVRRFRAPGALPSAPPRRTETIFKRARIATVLRGLCAAHAHGQVRSLAGRDFPVARVALTELVEAGEHALVRLSVAGAPPPLAPLEVTFGYFNSVFSFRVESAQAREGMLELPFPEQVVRRRNRRHRRRSALTGAYVTFRHPIWTDLIVRRPLFDVGPEGLSFAMPGADDALFAGLELPEILVSWPGRGLLSFAAEVRHVFRQAAPDQGEGEVLCGLKLIPLGPDDRAAWLSAIAEVFYPFTQLGRNRPAELWDLYEKSGYFELSGKSPEAFAEQKSAFTIASRRLTHASGIACQVVWPSVRGIEAAVTLVKPYSRTWMGYQLARRQDGEPPASPRDILREVILHGYEYPQRDPEFEWFVTWVQASGRFSRFLMHDLTRRFRDESDHAAIVRFRALEGDCSRMRVAPPSPGLTLGAPTASETTALLGTIRLSRPWPYVAAHDLLPGRFDLTSTRRAWNAARLLREREVVVVRRDGEAIAAAILELAHEGVHLFGLFDVVRLWALAEGGEAAYPELIEAARAWYAERGKKHFVYFCEHPDPSHVVQTGLKDLGEADMTVLSADLIPDQLEHAWEITIPEAHPQPGLGIV